MRFQVKPSHSDFGPTLFKVVDSRDGFRHVAIYSRRQLAESAALVFEHAYHAELRQGAGMAAS
jgi:hypothetical protein